MNRASVLTNERVPVRVLSAQASVAIALFASAFFVRILFNVFVVGMDEAGLERFPDGKDYDALGLSLAEGSGYHFHGAPNTFRPPGYPLFLAALYLTFGHSYAAIKVAQSLLGALTCLMILLIGERLFTRRVGLVASAIAAVYPFLVLYTGFLLSETLYVFLACVLLYALVRLREGHAAKWVALGGLVLGAMNLVRPVTLLFPALLFFWAWVEFGTRKRAALLAGVLTLWMLVPIVPWTVRNYVVTHSYLLIDDHHWLGLYISHNRTIMRDPEKIGGWLEPVKIEGFKPSFTTEDYRAASLSFLKEYLLHEPWELVRLEAYKLVRFWSVLPTSSKTTGRDAIISALSYGLLLPLAVIGVGLSFRGGPQPWVLIVWIGNFILVTLLAFGSTRFRAPVEPAITLFAALALDRGWTLVSGARGG